jgi:hypothetical protein
LRLTNTPTCRLISCEISVSCRASSEVMISAGGTRR